MTQLVITLKDQSYLPNIRRIVKSLQGVEKVNVARQKPVKLHVRKDNPMGALDEIGELIRSTGKSSNQLIGEYLSEKYSI